MKEAKDFQDVDSSHIVINGVFNSFLSYTATMLNIITIHALRKASALPKPLKTLFLSLAVSDLCIGLVIQPLNVAFLVMRLKETDSKNNPTDTIPGIVYQITATFFGYSSFFGVTALTADRFLAIHLHLRYQELVTHRRVVAVVTSSWVLSAILSLLRLWHVYIYSTVTGVIPTICLISTAFFYCKIYLAVRRHANQIQVLQVQQVGQNAEVMTNTARQMKSAVGTFYVYLVFLVCYLPHISINVVHVITGVAIRGNPLWDYTLTMVYLNSSLNPLIYCWKMRNIRHAVMNIVRSMFPSETTN